MADTFFLGLDAGTSITKAALFDGDGRQRAEAACRTTLSRPRPGWSELDPDEAWRAARTVLATVVAQAGIDPARIGGIGLSAAMVGAWVVDAGGTALRPGITWEDSRTQAMIARMRAAEPGLMSRIFASSGSVMQQGCTLPVLAWLLENEPATMARAAHVFGYKDFLRMKLTGLAATDRTEAAVAPGSAVERGRSQAMLALFGLSDHAHLLPRVCDSETVHGGLREEVAARTGLTPGLPVAVGAGDVAATVIGAGGLAPATATAVLGTTCMVGVCHDRPVFEPADIGLLFTLPAGRWYRAMVNVAGTLNLDWAIDALAPDLTGPDRYRKASALAESAPPGADGLVYLPYLSESGIIAPVVAPEARAAFAGLTPRHGRAALLRAVFEGVAFAMKDLFDGLAFSGEEVRLTGGGAQNPFWAQMIADLIETPVVVPAGTQFGARGAALLAATATGAVPSLAEAAAVDHGGRRYAPRPVARDDLHAALSRYRAARDRLLAGLH